MTGNATTGVIPEGRHSQGKKPCVADSGRPILKHFSGTRRLDLVSPRYEDQNARYEGLLHRLDPAPARIHVLDPAIVVGDVDAPPLAADFMVMRFGVIDR